VASPSTFGSPREAYPFAAGDANQYREINPTPRWSSVTLILRFTLSHYDDRMSGWICNFTIHNVTLNWLAKISGLSICSLRAQIAEANERRSRPHPV